MNLRRKTIGSYSEKMAPVEPRSRRPAERPLRRQPIAAALLRLNLQMRTKLPNRLADLRTILLEHFDLYSRPQCGYTGSVLMSLGIGVKIPPMSRTEVPPLKVRLHPNTFGDLGADS